MDLSIIRILTEKREGGMRKLASDIGMSEANLHRCVNNNKIQASDLEQIAIKLRIDIRQFFSDEVQTLANSIDLENSVSKPEDNKELISLCKSLVANYQQRDDVMNKLVSMVKEMG